MRCLLQKIKKMTRKSKTIFFSLVLISFLLLFITVIPAQVLSADEATETKFNQNIKFGTEEINPGDIDDGTAIGEYLNLVYRYAIGAVGILATAVMMFGGVL